MVDEKTAAPGTKSSSPTTPDKIDPAMMQMIKTMFQGFKVLIDIEVDGKIVKTNADYVNGPRVTLLELDMQQLFENEAALENFKKGNYEVAAGASAIAVKTGASKTAGYEHGVAIFTMGIGGLMFEASIGGQKFTYEPK